MLFTPIPTPFPKLLGLPSFSKLFHFNCLFPAINFWFLLSPKRKKCSFSRLLGNFWANSEKWGLFQTTLYITVKELSANTGYATAKDTHNTLCAHLSLCFVLSLYLLPFPISKNCISFSVKQVSQRKEHLQKSYTLYALKRRYLTW